MYVTDISIGESVVYLRQKSEQIFILSDGFGHVLAHMGKNQHPACSCVFCMKTSLLIFFQRRGFVKI